MSYNQFCPVAKAMEVLGEKWTFLVIRELLCGSTRFNELQRGLGQMSPTLLSKRLSELESHGLVIKRKIHGQRGHEYFPTEALNELLPVMELIGTWGMRWARYQLADEDCDLELLMVHIQKNICPEKLIGNQTIIRFQFIDLSEYDKWWAVVEGNDVDVCVHDPGKEIDIYFNVTLKDMCHIWMGDFSYKKAIADGKLQLIGPRQLIKNVDEWLKPSQFAGIPPARAIVDPAYQ